MKKSYRTAICRAECLQRRLCWWRSDRRKSLYCQSKSKTIFQIQTGTSDALCGFSGRTTEIFGWTEPVAYEPVYTLGANIFESMEKILESQEILKELPGLDCGSCGSPTLQSPGRRYCKSVDSARKEDCIYLMREQWKKHTGKKEGKEL